MFNRRQTCKIAGDSTKSTFYKRNKNNPAQISTDMLKIRCINAIKINKRLKRICNSDNKSVHDAVIQYSSYFPYYLQMFEV
jgi:hypothetical protein